MTLENLLHNKPLHLIIIGVVCFQSISCRVKSDSISVANYYNQKICLNIVDEDYWAANYKYKYFLDTIFKKYPPKLTDTTFVLFVNMNCGPRNRATVMTNNRCTYMEFLEQDEIEKASFGSHFENGKKILDTFQIKSRDFNYQNEARNHKIFRHYFQNSLDFDTKHHYCDPYMNIGLFYLLDSNKKIHYGFIYFLGNKFIYLTSGSYSDNLEKFAQIAVFNQLIDWNFDKTARKVKISY